MENEWWTVAVTRNTYPAKKNCKPSDGKLAVSLVVFAGDELVGANQNGIASRLDSWLLC
jgi:hypothetical protein